MRPVAQIAQSVEQGIENPRVGGSIPSLGTTFRFQVMPSTPESTQKARLVRAFCCLAKQYSAIRFQHSLLELVDVEWTRLPAGLAFDQRKLDSFDVGATGLAATNQVANMFSVAGVNV